MSYRDLIARKLDDAFLKACPTGRKGPWRIAVGKGAQIVTTTAGTIARRGKPPSRNDPCPCKSGKKFKKCCGAKALTKYQLWAGRGELVASFLCRRGETPPACYVKDPVCLLEFEAADLGEAREVMDEFNGIEPPDPQMIAPVVETPMANSVTS